MGDIGLFAFKLSIRLSFVVGAISALVILMSFVFNLVFVTMNQTVLSDLFKLIQIGLPFNLNVLLIWFVTATVAYVWYRICVVALNYVVRLTGE